MAKMTITFPGAGALISTIPAGEIFEFSGSTKGNNGPAIRVKDSKAGKNRFVNLETGKLLTAGCRDRGVVYQTAELCVD